MIFHKSVKVWAKSRILRFLVVGLWNAFFSLGLYYLLLFFLGTQYYEIALFISFVFSTLQSYFMQKKYVWISNSGEGTQLPHFILVCISQYLLNAITMYFLVSKLQLSTKIMQIPVSFVIAVLSYFYFKSKVFRVT